MASWDIEQELWERALSELDDATAARIASDPFAHSFYHEAMWNWDLAGDTRADMYANFTAYMDQYFDVEWEEIFDWDDWRSAYDSQAS